MSKNITIQEGGSAVQLTADKLKTDQVGGGSVLWVPEDEVSLGTKRITENGTYEAAADGKYGYSTVTVSVPGGPDGPASDTPGSIISGIDPEDGEEYTWETVEDPETGETIVIKTPMPSGIQITTLPSDLDYTDGETIDFTGIVVKLKKYDGTVYTDENYPDGIIPFSELTFPVTVADFDAVENPHAVYDGGQVEGTKVMTARQWTGVGTSREKLDKTITVTAPEGGFIILQEPNGATVGFPGLCVVSQSPGALTYVWGPGAYEISGGPEGAMGSVSLDFVRNNLIDGSPIYHALCPSHDWTSGTGGALVERDPTLENTDVPYYISPADIILAGDVTGGGQVIPVQWTPPASKFNSNKTRSTTYEINVTAASSGGTTVDNEGFSGNEGNF